jgi:hypothetical protein
MIELMNGLNFLKLYVKNREKIPVFLDRFNHKNEWLSDAFQDFAKSPSPSTTKHSFGSSVQVLIVAT